MSAAAAAADALIPNLHALGDRSASAQLATEAASALGPAAVAEPTTSCTRGFNDLDPVRFTILIGALCAARTAVQQPLNLALVRKQCCPIAAGMSTSAIIHRIVLYEGGVVVGLSQGMLALIAANALSETVYMLGYEFLRETLPIETSTAREATSGYMGDAVSRLVHIPLLCVANRQMINHKFQATATSSVASGPRLGMVGTVRSIYAENGIRSLYNGFATSLTIGCCWTGAWWASYDFTKNVLYGWLNATLDHFHVPAKHFDKNGAHTQTAGTSSSTLWASLPDWATSSDDNFVVNSIASIVASGGTALVFNPFLVIRTRLTTTPGGTFLSVSRSIMKQGGLRSFWVGSWLNVSTSIFDGYLGSTSYEIAKLWSDKSRL